MKVLLINAPYPISKMFGTKRPVPFLVNKNLGIGYIAAGLEMQGHSVTFMDCAALGIGIDEAVDNVQEYSPDAIGIPCFVSGRFLVYDLVRTIKDRMPHLPVVVGGPQVTLFAEDVFAESPDITIALCGEAEFSFATLITRLEKGGPIADIPGIVFRDSEGCVQKGPPHEVAQDLDSYPFPARHVYDQNLYNPMPLTLTLPSMRTEQVITSRGCNWSKCRFCYQSNANMPCYRRRSPENVIAELRGLVDEAGIEFVVFLDDDFTVGESWLNRFCDLYEREKFDLKWKVNGRVNTVARDILRRIAKCGCVHITYGLESGNQETLDLIRKGTTLAQARDAVKWSHEAGLLVRAYIMFGLPRETPEMAEKSLKFAIDLDLDYVTFLPYHVMRKTALEEIALQEGRSVPHDNLDLQRPSYVPNTYKDAEHLSRVIQKAYRRFYVRRRYIVRALWSVKNPKLWPIFFSRIKIGLQYLFLGKI